MESDKEIFARWLRSKLKMEGAISGKELAEKIGSHPSTVSGWIGTKSKGPPIDKALKICEVFEENYNDVLNAERERARTEKFKKDSDSRRGAESPIDFKAKILADHYEIIQRFKDPETAKKANELMLELETIDIEFYYEIIGKMLGRIKKIKLQESTESQPPHADDLRKTGTAPD